MTREKERKIDLKKLVKSKLLISGVLEHYGNIPNSNPDSNWECSHHNSEKKNSLKIYEDSNTCNCFGCELSGDPLNIIALYEKLDIKKDFSEILEIGCKMAGLDYKLYNSRDTSKYQAEREIKAIILKAHIELYKLVKSQFHKILPYVREKRNLTIEEEEKLDLGYLPPDKWQNFKQILKLKIPEIDKVFYEEKDKEGKIIKTKYLINTYQALSGRIIHPHFYRGDLLYFTGEVTKNAEYDLNTKYVKINAHFSATGHAEGYFLDALDSDKREEIIFPEGFVDILRLNINGINSVGFGTCKISNYFIENYHHKLKKFKKIIIVFDTEPNSAGLEGAIAFAKKLLVNDIANVYISELPSEDGNKIDIDDLLAKIPDIEEKKKAIQKYVIEDRIIFWKYLMEDLKKAETNPEKVKIVENIVEIAQKYDILTQKDIYKEIKNILNLTQEEFKRNFLKNVEKEEPDEKTEKSKEEKSETHNICEIAFSLNPGSPVKAFSNLAESFLKDNPAYFDTQNKLWWVWNKIRFAWEKKVENDILRNFKNEYGILAWIETSNRVKIMKAMEVIADKKPKEVPKEWIQFKNIVYNLNTDEEFFATSEYFFTSPLAFKLSNSDLTPTIDKLFGEWVGKKKETLYELIAYSMYRGYPLAKVFFLYGIGRNGKGVYRKILSKFVGVENIASTKIEKLKSEGRFEILKCKDKLVLLINEPDNSDDKKFISTGNLKEMSGGDLIGAERKGVQEDGQNNFESYAKAIVLTNHYPKFNDVSDGWVSRVFIIDFIRTFEDSGKDLILSIPDEEFENLGKKSINILKKLLKTGKFSHEDSYEEKKKKIREKSAIIEQFMEEMTLEDETEEVDLDFLFFTLELYCKARNVTPPLRKQLKVYIQENVLEFGTKIKRSTKTAKFLIPDEKDILREVNAKRWKEGGKKEDITLHSYIVRGLKLNYPIIHDYPLFSVQNAYIQNNCKMVDKGGYMDNNWKNIPTIYNFNKNNNQNKKNLRDINKEFKDFLSKGDSIEGISIENIRFNFWNKLPETEKKESLEDFLSKCDKENICSVKSGFWMVGK